MVRRKNVLVVVSGGGDPIHIACIRLFERIRKLGEKLVVILNKYNLKNRGYSDK